MKDQDPLFPSRYNFPGRIGPAVLKLPSDNHSVSGSVFSVSSYILVLRYVSERRLRQVDLGGITRPRNPKLVSKVKYNPKRAM